jgi:hypothetical protein
MKTIAGIAIMLFITYSCAAQVSYYKGEWTVKNKTDLFNCLCKLEIKNNTSVVAEFAWTFISIDSTNTELLDSYKNKKGKTGIEYTEGTFNPATGDINLIAVRLADPHEILGMTKYQLKFSFDKMAIYGTTTGIENDEPGLFYAVAMKKSEGSQKFNVLKNKVQ